MQALDALDANIAVQIYLFDYMKNQVSGKTLNIFQHRIERAKQLKDVALDAVAKNDYDTLAKCVSFAAEIQNASGVEVDHGNDVVIVDGKEVSLFDAVASVRLSAAMQPETDWGDEEVFTQFLAGLGNPLTSPLAM